MKDILDLLEQIEDTEREGTYRKRGKFKVKYASIKREDMIKMISDKANLTNEQVAESLRFFELFVKDLEKRALNEKISFKIPFLDDKLKIEFYDSREVRNPAKNKAFISNPKVQVKFLNKRKDKV